MSFNPTQTSMAHDLARSRRFLLVEDVDLIQQAVRTMLPVDRLVQVVDLGAGSGTTALSVFCARSTQIRVLTVDHDPVALASTGQCMTNAGFRHLWTPMEAKTAEYGARLVPFLRFDEKADFLMVDASHEYEDVRADLAAWLPLVRPGAPVYCHDYTDEYPGCRQAINEAIAEGRLIPVEQAGWGILLRTPGADSVAAEVQS